MVSYSVSGSVHADEILDLVDGRYEPSTVNLFSVQLADLLLLVVVFVLNVAHDGLEQILHGDEALGAAVLVHDDGDLHLALGHLLEEVAALLALGNEIGGAHELGDRHVRRSRRDRRSWSRSLT